VTETWNVREMSRETGMCTHEYDVGIERDMGRESERCRERDMCRERERDESGRHV